MNFGFGLLADVASRTRGGRSIARAVTSVAVVAGAFAAWPAAAQDIDAVSRDLDNIEVQSRLLRDQTVRQANLRSRTYIEERLADGELFFRLQDYIRASIVFTDIVDNHQQHAAYPDALFLLAESLFHAGDYLGSRTRFREVVDRVDDRRFQEYAQRSLGRLIEIAIRTRDFEGVEDHFQRLSRLPPSEVEGTTSYFRAKYLYNRAVPTEDVLAERPSAQVDLTRLEEARTAFAAVPEGSAYRPQALYFIGVIHALRREWPQAIQAFQRVLSAPATLPEHETVADLTRLALGRLYYESDQLDQAVEAYQAVPRTSSHFDAALFEISWVYIRLGDAERAERALEVLSLAAPDSRYIPDAKLLRGNLLLRNGRLDDAETSFRDVAREFSPVRRELDQMAADRGDLRAYFRELVRQNLDAFDASAFLPQIAARWTQRDADGERALSVLSDLSQARTLVRETTRLIERLSALVGSPNLISAFPDLRQQRQTSISLRNRLARSRQQLMTLETQATGSVGGELAAVRAERLGLEEILGRLPTSDADFTARNERILGAYRRLARELRDAEVAVMGIDARIVAMERYLETTEGQHPDPSAVANVRTELATHRQAAAQFRELIAEYNLQIERGRVQVGVGDVRSQRDETQRQRYNELVAREHQLAAQSGSPILVRIDSLLTRMGTVEATLDAKDGELNRAVEERTASLRSELEQERARVEGYQTQLAALEAETTDVVGGVTYQTYDHVRQRFYDLVLRADVGRIDVSWSRREEHRTRVEMLTRDRAREIQALDDEFREITDAQNPNEREEEQSEGEGL